MRDNDRWNFIENMPALAAGQMHIGIISSMNATRRRHFNKPL